MSKNKDEDKHMSPSEAWLLINAARNQAGKYRSFVDRVIFENSKVTIAVHKPTGTTVELYTREDVCEILCGGCRLGLDRVYGGDGPFHVLNDVHIPCNASQWIQKEARYNPSTNKDTNHE